MKRVSLIIIVLIFWLFPAAGQGRDYLVITGSGFKKVTIAVPPMKEASAEKLPGDAAGLLNKDLDLSGFFIVTPPSLMDKELLAEGTERNVIKFSNWRSMGIDLLCKGKVQVQNNEFILEASLYDSLDGSLLFAKRYKVGQAEWRKVIHRLADEIILAATGERGIMSSRLLFVAGRRNFKEIYTADFDGENVQKITNNRNITLSPSLSPGGKYLAYTSYKEGKPNLFVVDSEKHTEVFADRSEGMKIGSSWLNGSTLVYAHTSGKQSTICAYDVARKEKKILLQKEGILTSPAVSADGKKLLFVSDMYGSPQIFLRDNGSGEIKRLTYYGNYNSAPAWSPKGDLITFVSKLDGGFEICLMNSDGSNQRVLTADGTINDSPQFSGDGRYIIYSSQKGGRYGIHFMLFNGDNKRMVKLTDANEEQPRFFQ